MTASRTSRVFSIAEAGERLGVSSQTMYRLIANGDLRICDVRSSGKRALLRIREDDLADFIDARTVAATKTA